MENLTLIVGSNGQLGSELVKFYKEKGEPSIGLNHRDIEVTDYDNVRRVMAEYNPRVVINTAAYHKVDACEENPQHAFGINAIGARNVAIACADVGATLVHMGTDYVFDGEMGSPYREENSANPVNVYGTSKIAGEMFVQNILPEHFIIRTAAIQGLSKSSVKGSNFIETMLKLGKERGLVQVVSDQITSPTYAPDLADGIFKLIRTGAYGTYHLTNKGNCSWYEFAKEIFAIENVDVKVVPIPTDEASKLFNYKARRPLNTSLDISKAEATGVKMRLWQSAVAAYLNEGRANGISN
jgi:dTDP-4-dehydrorhamnose reductase